jgi:hypothetical protein
MMTLHFENFPLIESKDLNHDIGITNKGIHFEKIFKVVNRPNTCIVPLNDKKLIPSPQLRKSNGYFVELLFHGLNYHAKRIKRRRPKYYVDMHRSEIFTIDEKISNEFKSRVHKRRLLFFSFNKHLLDNIIREIKAFRVPNVYTGKGLFERNDPYKIKPGKIRAR